MSTGDIVGEFINELQIILNTNIPDVERDIIDNIKADADETLSLILENNGVKTNKLISIINGYSREIGKIKDKLRQLEEERVYEPRLGKYSKMDGSLYTNIIQLKEMLNDLLDKVEYNKQSDNEKLREYFEEHKI